MMHRVAAPRPRSWPIDHPQRPCPAPATLRTSPLHAAAGAAVTEEVQAASPKPKSAKGGRPKASGASKRARPAAGPALHAPRAPLLWKSAAALQKALQLLKSQPRVVARADGLCAEDVFSALQDLSKSHGLVEEGLGASVVYVAELTPSPARRNQRSQTSQRPQISQDDDDGGALLGDDVTGAGAAPAAAGLLRYDLRLDVLRAERRLPVQQLAEAATWRWDLGQGSQPAGEGEAQALAGVVAPGASSTALLLPPPQQLLDILLSPTAATALLTVHDGAQAVVALGALFDARGRLLGRGMDCSFVPLQDDGDGGDAAGRDTGGSQRPVHLLLIKRRLPTPVVSIGGAPAPLQAQAEAEAAQQEEATGMSALEAGSSAKAPALLGFAGGPQAAARAMLAQFNALFPGAAVDEEEMEAAAGAIAGGAPASGAPAATADNGAGEGGSGGACEAASHDGDSGGGSGAALKAARRRERMLNAALALKLLMGNGRVRLACDAEEGLEEVLAVLSNMTLPFEAGSLRGGILAEFLPEQEAEDGSGGAAKRQQQQQAAGPARMAADLTLLQNSVQSWSGRATHVLQGTPLDSIARGLAAPLLLYGKWTLALRDLCTGADVIAALDLVLPTLEAAQGRPVRLLVVPEIRRSSPPSGGGGGGGGNGSALAATEESSSGNSSGGSGPGPGLANLGSSRKMMYLLHVISAGEYTLPLLNQQPGQAQRQRMRLPASALLQLMQALYAANQLTGRPDASKGLLAVQPVSVRSGAASAAAGAEDTGTKNGAAAAAEPVFTLQVVRVFDLSPEDTQVAFSMRSSNGSRPAVMARALASELWKRHMVAGRLGRGGAGRMAAALEQDGLEEMGEAAHGGVEGAAEGAWPKSEAGLEAGSSGGSGRSDSGGAAAAGVVSSPPAAAAATQGAISRHSRVVVLRTGLQQALTNAVQAGTLAQRERAIRGGMRATLLLLPFFRRVESEREPGKAVAMIDLVCYAAKAGAAGGASSRP